MFNWFKNKLIQINTSLYKKEMETFLSLLKASEHLDNMVYLSKKGALEFAMLYNCDLYKPFSDLEKYPGLDMALFEQREKARKRGDHPSEKAIELWLHTVRGVAYPDHPELLALSKEIWLELGRSSKIRYPEGFEPPIKTLAFKDGKSAFEYSCHYMDCGLRNGSILPALVLDSCQLFGTETAVKVSDNGLQTCALKVASDDGGFLVFAQTVGAKGPKLEPGMLVAWQAGAYSADVVKANSGDQRLGWVGLIVAALHPDLDIENGWKILAPFKA